MLPAAFDVCVRGLWLIEPKLIVIPKSVSHSRTLSSIYIQVHAVLHVEGRFTRSKLKFYHVRSVSIATIEIAKVKTCEHGSTTRFKSTVRAGMHWCIHVFDPSQKEALRCQCDYFMSAGDGAWLKMTTTGKYVASILCIILRATLLLGYTIKGRITCGKISHSSCQFVDNYGKTKRTFCFLAWTAITKWLLITYRTYGTVGLHFENHWFYDSQPKQT